MALDAHHATLSSEVEEGFFEFFVFVVHYEADVHERAVFLSHSSAEKLIAVYLSINDLSTLMCEFVHCSYASIGLYPTKILEHAVDGHYWRSVEH